MMHKSTRSFFAVTFRYLVGLSLTIAIWQTIVILFGLPSYVVPTPLETFSVIYSARTDLAVHAGWTVLEATLGLTLAVTVAVITAAVISQNRRLGSGLVSTMAAAQAIPIVAVAPLLTLWFGGDLISKAVMSAVLCYFPFSLALVRGLSQTPREYVDLFRVYHGGRWQEFFRLRAPAAVPTAMSGLRSSASLAMIGAIVAEYTGSDSGLGYVVMQATYRVDTPRIFAAVLIAAAAGLSFYGLVAFAERSALRRYYRGLDA